MGDLADVVEPAPDGIRRPVPFREGPTLCTIRAVNAAIGYAAMGAVEARTFELALGG